MLFCVIEPSEYQIDSFCISLFHWVFQLYFDMTCCKLKDQSKTVYLEIFEKVTKQNNHTNKITNDIEVKTDLNKVKSKYSLKKLL